MCVCVCVCVRVCEGMVYIIWDSKGTKDSRWSGPVRERGKGGWYGGGWRLEMCYMTYMKKDDDGSVVHGVASVLSGGGEYI